MNNFRKNAQDKIKQSKVDEKAKNLYDQSKKYAAEKDLKNNASGIIGKFIEGLKRLDVVPVLITTLLMMMIIWVPMMYGAMTISLIGDGMSNKELTQLQHRLDDRYEKQLGE